MKIAATIARLLLGLTFTVFGLNGFLHFFPVGPMPNGPAGQFASVLAQTHYLDFICGVQLACGIMLLLNLYVPMTLVVIAPVIVNILLFHITMAPSGIVPGLILTVLWIIVAFRVRSAFTGLFQMKIR